nr:hypothetical protein GCM10020092_069130 [Actinoplanes digitatis]
MPAHTYVLKCSQAFNVLDSRGAVSTADRAAEFARMRRLAGDVAKLWQARREELGHPLGLIGQAPPAEPAAAARTGDEPRTLVFEIGTEELPPSEARAAREELRRTITDGLGTTRLHHGDIQVLATPRRLIAVVAGVAAREEDHVRVVKGPKVAAAYDADGVPTKALQGFLQGQGATLAEVEEQDVKGARHVVVVRQEAGGAAPEVLAGVLAKIVSGLRSSKNMRWNDPQLSFSRPVRWLTALWGDDVVPVAVSTLAARPHHPAAAHRGVAGGAGGLGGDLPRDPRGQRHPHRPRGPPHRDRRRRHRPGPLRGRHRPGRARPRC